MFTIKTRNGSLLGCVTESKPYVIGFTNLKTVSKVSHILRIPPNITLKRKHIIDVTEEVKDGLVSMGIEEFAFNNINIDVEALLSIEKASIFDCPEDFGTTQISLMDECDFLFMSFQHNIGLIIPFEELDENETQITFKASVIDPNGDSDIFKQFLDKN
jgi:hypothetical protein